MLEGLLSICTRKVALRRDLNIKGRQEAGLVSRFFVAVAFLPRCSSSKTLPGARIIFILGMYDS